MIKKHFKALADALKDSKPLDNDVFDKQVQWHKDIDAVADVCRNMNRAFDAERFYAACGYND